MPRAKGVPVKSQSTAQQQYDAVLEDLFRGRGGVDIYARLAAARKAVQAEAQAAIEARRGVPRPWESIVEVQERPLRWWRDADDQ